MEASIVVAEQQGRQAKRVKSLTEDCQEVKDRLVNDGDATEALKTRLQQEAERHPTLEQECHEQIKHKDDQFRLFRDDADERGYYQRRAHKELRMEAHTLTLNQSRLTVDKRTAYTLSLQCKPIVLCNCTPPIAQATCTRDGHETNWT